jgi:hypothetical protein
MEIILHLLNWGLYLAIVWVAAGMVRRWRAWRGSRR